MNSSSSPTPDQTPDQNPQSLDPKKKKKKKGKAAQAAGSSIDSPQTPLAEPVFIYQDGRLSINESMILNVQDRYGDALKTAKKLFPEWDIEMCRMIALIFCYTAQKYSVLTKESGQENRKLIEGHKLPSAQLEGALKVINGAEERALTDGVCDAITKIQEYNRDYKSSAILHLKFCEKLFIHSSIDLELINSSLGVIRFLVVSGIDASHQIYSEYFRLQRNYFLHKEKAQGAFLAHKNYLSYLPPEKRKEANEQYIKMLKGLASYYQETEQKKPENQGSGKSMLVVNYATQLSIAVQGPECVITASPEAKEESNLADNNASDMNVIVNFGGMIMKMPLEVGQSMRLFPSLSDPEPCDLGMGRIIYPQKDYESLSAMKRTLDEQFEKLDIPPEFKKLENKKNQLREQFLRCVEKHKSFIKRIIKFQDLSPAQSDQAIAEEYTRLGKTIAELEAAVVSANLEALVGSDSNERGKKNKSGSIESKLTALDLKFKNLEAEHKDSIEKFQAGMAENKTLSDNLEKEREERKKLAGQLTALKAEREGQLEKLRNDRAKMLEEQKAIQMEWGKSFEKFEGLQKEREKLAASLNSEQTLRSTLEAKLAGAESQDRSLAAELGAEQSKRRELEAKLAVAQNQNKQKAAQLEAEKAKNRDLGSRLQASQKLCSYQAGQLGSQLQTLDGLAQQHQIERAQRLSAETFLAIERDKYSHLIASYNQLQSFSQVQGFFAQMQQQGQGQVLGFGSGSHTPSFFPPAQPSGPGAGSESAYDTANPSGNSPVQDKEDKQNTK